MKTKSLRSNAAGKLVAEMRKLVPHATADELLGISVAASAIGCVLAHSESWGLGIRIYGGVIFIVGLIASVILFDREHG